MDLLKTAVVDITTMVAACHAMTSGATEGEEAPRPKLRGRLRRDLKRGAVSYIEVLARTRCAGVDRDLLVKCRLAAEHQMPRALENQELLARIMGSEAGSLDGLAAIRQDLWRLASVAIHLSTGMVELQGSTDLIDPAAAQTLAARLRRRFRKALIAYARAALRTKSPKGRLIDKARRAALDEIGARGAMLAERLADIEASAAPATSVIRLGVNRPLMDLALDWQRRDPA